MDLSGYAGVIPDVAMDAFQERGIEQIPLENGVSRISMSGHDQGVAYRFFIHTVYNKIKSNEVGYEVFDEIEMIEWLIDRRSKPVERVKELPSELLRFNREGVCVGGKYKDSYDAFKAGKNAPGMPLARWGILSDGDVASLAADGIFSVEQFADIPADKVQSRFPDSFVEAHQRAKQYCAGKALLAQNAGQAEKVAALEQENAQMAERLAKLEALLDKQTAPAEPKSVPLNPPKRPIIEVGK